ncbi:MAG: low molecular weight phosphotyrosine protein phosphatase [Oscillospiraceae bacterium]|nr:low molecular weight phosphotyrosine protein phosphatase [Oscillospiraceae bacterium]
MLKILFVCHGNICRSPMAEYIMRDLLQKRGITEVTTASAATSTEELGNPVHRGTREVLKRLGIDCSDKRARQIKKSDYEEYDLLLGMDAENLRNMLRLWGDPEHKIYKLLDYAEIGAPQRNKDVADPWYTGDFERTYSDIKAGCEGIIAAILRGGFDETDE